MRTLPKIVTQLCHLHDAWIVGRLPEREDEEPRDYDVMVTFENWRKAVVLVPADARPNSFGGWKFMDEGRTVDVWPGDMAWVMSNAHWKAAWHPKTNTKVGRL